MGGKHNPTIDSSETYPREDAPAQLKSALFQGTGAYFIVETKRKNFVSKSVSGCVFLCISVYFAPTVGDIKLYL